MQQFSPWENYTMLVSVSGARSWKPDLLRLIAFGFNQSKPVATFVNNCVKTNSIFDYAQLSINMDTAVSVKKSFGNAINKINNETNGKWTVFMNYFEHDFDSLIDNRSLIWDTLIHKHNNNQIDYDMNSNKNNNNNNNNNNSNNNVFQLSLPVSKEIEMSIINELFENSVSCNKNTITTQTTEWNVEAISAKPSVSEEFNPFTSTNKSPQSHKMLIMKKNKNKQKMVVGNKQDKNEEKFIMQAQWFDMYITKMKFIMDWEYEVYVYGPNQNEVILNNDNGITVKQANHIIGFVSLMEKVARSLKDLPTTNDFNINDIQTGNGIQGYIDYVRNTYNQWYTADNMALMNEKPKLFECDVNKMRKQDDKALYRNLSVNCKLLIKAMMNNNSECIVMLRKFCTEYVQNQQSKVEIDGEMDDKSERITKKRERIINELNNSVDVINLKKIINCISNDFLLSKDDNPNWNSFVNGHDNQFVKGEIAAASGNIQNDRLIGELTHMIV